MRISRHGLKTLVLAIVTAVFGVMALTAVGAQAQHGKLHTHELALNPSPLASPNTNTAGVFLVDLSAALAKEVGVNGDQEDASRLLVQGRNLTIECQNGGFNNGSKIVSSTDAVLFVLFRECVAWNFAQTETLPCTVLSPGEPTGSLVANALALPILHGGKNFVLFEPISGPLILLELHGAECPLPLATEVKGAVSAEVTTNHAVQILVIFSPGIQLLTGDKLIAGPFPSYIDASVTMSLKSPHLDKTLTVE